VTFEYHLVDRGRRTVIGSLAIKEKTLAPAIDSAA
jgi:hypothetical protein